MKRLIYPLLFCLALFSACSSPNPLQSTPSNQVSPSPSMTITSTPKPTSTATASRPTDTAAPPSPIPTDTVILSPTLPPAGVFANLLYPPLVLDYPTERWLDKSDYYNETVMGNYLQHLELKSCTIGPMGASGFYPENMKEINLGSIVYRVFLGQKNPDGKEASYYFAMRTPAENFETATGGVPHFAVRSSPADAKKCRAAAEAVLATLRRADQPKQSYCDLLAQRYQPPGGFKTCCDADYGFAFDYPQNWDITFVTGSSDSPGSPVQWVRKAQRFSAPDGSNFVRADTYRLGSRGLSNKVEAFFGYDERKFPEKDYPSLKIGGQRAYVTINQWVQDISAVYLFFQHGDYYTIMELKAPSPSALDLNWKIAASIQTPGTSPQDNEIPEEMIKDSYSLTGSK